MLKRKLSIVLEELPLRPAKLSLDKVSEIFGGCKHSGSNCEKSSECCGDLHCTQIGVLRYCM